ncbi:MAG: GAF domain-containing protein, partial [Desulfotignum sp.]
MQSDPKKNLHCDLPDWEFASGYKNGQRLCVEALTGELSEANNRLHQEEISRRKVEEALNKRLRFETLLFDLSARFLKISPEEIDPEMKSALNRIREFFQFDRSGLRELARDGTPKQITRGGYAVDLADSIEEWLRRIAVFFDADRCSLRVFSDGDTRLGRVFDFCRKGLKPVPASLSKDELPWYMTQLIQGKSVVMERLESLPQAAEKERLFCLAGNIKSVLSVPMTSGKNIIGVFALASIHEERAWPRELVQQMRFVGDVFAGALARRKMEMELRERFQEIGRLKQQLEQENICLKKEIELQQAHDEMVGRSPAIREILSMIERV